MQNPSQFARRTASAVSVAYAIALYASGLHLQNSVKEALAYLPTALGLGIVAFDLHLWKLPGVHVLAGRPRIDGAWVGHLTPHRDSDIPRGGNRGPIEMAMIIEQTYWSLAITLLTQESSSASTSAALRSDGESRERRVLVYTYANNPKLKQRPRSQPHIGAAQLLLVGLEPGHIQGMYWTDRRTVGDMDLRLVNRRTGYATLQDVIAAAAEPSASST